MAKGFLTTHVLDTARGVPVEGLVIDLFVIEADQRNHIRSLPTNSDGRTDGQIFASSRIFYGDLRAGLSRR